MTAPVEFDYATLYGLADVDCEFCLATHKPGICAGTRRTGTVAAPPGQRPHVAVPTSPAPKSAQQVATEQQQDAVYRAAYQRAQDEAQALGGNHRHAAVQGAMRDYARAASVHGRAVAADQAARTRLQALHDAAVKRNQAIDASNATARQAAAARAAAQTAHAALVARQKALHQAARAHQHHRPHHSIDVDESSLYGLEELELYSLLASAHWWCGVNEFCRNPLHPGPCKGWKHMLHSVAPGAYHAYEEQRVKKLNEKRKAKIAELEAAGKKVPAYLKKEVTYQQVPKAPEGTPFQAPTPKEAISKLPATAKEIGAKIAMKHEAIAQAKAEKLKAGRTAALLSIVEHHQGHMPDSQQKVMTAKIGAALDGLKAGEKPSDLPIFANTINIVANKAAKDAQLNDAQKAELIDNLKQHVDEGVPEKPILLTSAANQAKKLKDEKGKAALKSAQGDALHNIAVATSAAGDNEGAKKAFHNVIETAHANLPESGKVSEAPGMPAVINHLAQKANGQLSDLHGKLGKTGPGISEVAKQVKEHIDEGKPGLPPALAAIPGLEKQVKTKSDLASLQKKLEAHGTGRHVGNLTPTGKVLGTHGAKVAKDETGKEFLVKPADFTSKGEIGASKLAAAVGLKTPQVHNVPEGIAQEMVPGAKDAFPGKVFDPAKLSDKDILDLQKHHVLDWLIGNHDAHPGNFLRDEHGDLVEIDKGQAFKHYHEDQLSPNYHPNAAYGETEPVYNTLMKAAKKGDALVNDPNQGELADFIKKVQDVPDDKLKAMFKPYAEAAAKSGFLPGAPKGGKLGEAGANPAAVEDFLNKIVDRKSKLKTSFSALYHNNQPAVAKAPDIEQHLAKATEDKLAEKGVKLASGPVAPHVQEAHELASGAKYGNAKQKVTAYEKLTADEYHSLPLEVQDAINVDLNTAHAKFLDPKKKQQVKDILNKIGLPKATPEGAGAPHEPAAEESHYDKMGKAHAAIQQLITGQPSKMPASGYAKWYSENSSLADTQAMVQGLSSKWKQNHLNGLPLSLADKDKIEEKAKAEIQQMILKGHAEPPSGGVLYTAEKMPATANAEGKSALLKHAAGVEGEPLAGAGAGGPTKTKTQEALDILGQPGSKSLTEKASGLTKEHFDALPPSSQKYLIESLKDLEADAGPAVSLKATQLIEKFTGKGEAAAPKKVTSKPGLGKGKLINKIPVSVKKQMLDAYKGHGSASYLKATPEENYQAVLNVAHAFHNKPGAGTLSLSQVIDTLDEQQAQKLGVTNTGMLKQKITDWLATPEGKKVALKLKPDTGKVEALSGGYVKPVKPANLPKGAKVPKVGGPGPYKAAQGGFVPHKHHQMLKLQDDYQKATDQQWNADQIKAIKSYTDTSTYINGWLREGTYGGTAAPQNAIHLQSAMLPIQENAALSRGTGWEQLPPGFRTPEDAKKLVGKTISDPGFVSTAIKGESHGFSSKPVIMDIEAPKGTMGAYLEHITTVSGEYEMLLAAGTKFKVISVTEGYVGGGKKTIVKCRVVS